MKIEVNLALRAFGGTSRFCSWPCRLLVVDGGWGVCEFL